MPGVANAEVPVSPTEELGVTTPEEVLSTCPANPPAPPIIVPEDVATATPVKETVWVIVTVPGVPVACAPTKLRPERTLP